MKVYLLCGLILHVCFVAAAPSLSFAHGVHTDMTTDMATSKKSVFTEEITGSKKSVTNELTTETPVTETSAVVSSQKPQAHTIITEKTLQTTASSTESEKFAITSVEPKTTVTTSETSKPYSSSNQSTTTTGQLQSEIETTFSSDESILDFEDLSTVASDKQTTDDSDSTTESLGAATTEGEATTESPSEYTNDILDPLQCPISYTGSQCNFQTYWCPNSVCIGNNNGKGNCYSYTSYECHCPKNGTCKIENATPSWLNDMDCFDINTANHGHGHYYNFFAEYQNYNDEPIQRYMCGCQKNYGQKGAKHCSISTCEMNSTNPCTSDDGCIPTAPLASSLNILYCRCQPGSPCFNSNTTDYCTLAQPCPSTSTCLAPFTDSYFTSTFNPFNLTTSYTCTCPSQHPGACFKPSDPCAQPSSQCLNGGTCIAYTSPNNDLRSTCMCPEGTTGANCESFLKCLEPQVACYFNGKCLYSLEDYFLGNDYTCECAEGFAGKYCDECLSTTCLNGGKCALNFASRLECLCPYGYRGARCEVRYDFCEFSSQFMCSNASGECSAYKDYYCQCDKVAGKCRKQVCDFQTGCHDTGDACLAPPDFHSYGCNCYLHSRTLSETEDSLNGRCNLGNMNSCNERIYSTSQSINWFYETVKADNLCTKKDSCSFGFDSYMSYFTYFCQCEINMPCLKGFTDPCAKNLCSPGLSTCLATSLVDSYYCKANANVSGGHLMLAHPCVESPCKNGGTCLAQVSFDEDGHIEQKAKCLCPKGAFGESCESLVNYCQIDFCGINGNCTNTSAGKFRCDCKSGYTGKFCDISLVI